jgi:hypothetical protein
MRDVKSMLKISCEVHQCGCCTAARGTHVTPGGWGAGDRCGDGRRGITRGWMGNCQSHSKGGGCRWHCRGGARAGADRDEFRSEDKSSTFDRVEIWCFGEAELTLCCVPRQPQTRRRRSRSVQPRWPPGPEPSGSVLTRSHVSSRSRSMTPSPAIVIVSRCSDQTFH